MVVPSKACLRKRKQAAGRGRRGRGGRGAAAAAIEATARAKRTSPGWPLTVRRARTSLRRRSRSKVAAARTERVERARATFRSEFTVDLKSLG